MTYLTFIGDISLNDHYNNLYDSGVNPFTNVIPFLKGSDYVTGNLECISESSNGTFNQLKNPRLKTKTSTLNYLKDINLNLATLAHNHIYDNLFNGFNQTVTFLDEKNIDYLGAGKSKKEAQKPIIKIIKNKQFCFLNYVTEDTNPSMPHQSELYLNIFNETSVIADIKCNSNNDYIILLLHWGGDFENGNFPSLKQQKVAHRLIDAGADLIIGHHSHTLQPYEKYKGKYIFYSLGNFCFADIVSDGKIKPIDRKRNKKSVILTIKFKDEVFKIHKTYIKNRDLNIIVDNLGKFDYLLKQSVFILMKHFHLFWYMYYFFYKFIDPVLYQLSTINRKNIIQRIKSFKFSKLKGLTR